MNLSVISDVARLRNRAARIDADYASRELEAEKALRSIRYQNAVADLNRLLVFREPAPAPTTCGPCLEYPAVRR